MPYIDEKDLLALHDQIDREKLTNSKLLDQINEKGKAYKRCAITRNLGLIASALLLAGGLAACYYLYGMLKESEQATGVCQEKETLYRQQEEELLLLKNQRDSLLLESHNLQEEALISDVVYSVQIGAFEHLDIPLRSTWSNYSYSPTYRQLYAFSIGIFKTVEEAREFQKIIIRLGFSDAFVASYQNGNRIAIESE